MRVAGLQPPHACGRPTVRSRAVQAPQSDLALRRRTAADVDWETARQGVLVAGAGIAGLATAVALQKVGIPALVLERHAEQRRAGSAIGLWPNAFRALDALGAAQPLRDAHPLLQRVELCAPDGGTLKRFHLDECGGGGPHEFRGVLRSRLLQALQEQLAPGSVVYGSPIEAVQATPQGAAVSLPGGLQPGARAVIGADGARSQIAASLGLATPNYAGYSAYRGVAEFGGLLPVALDTVRQILGRGVRAGMYPLSETSLYWFIAMTCPEEGGPQPADYKADAQRLVAGWGCGIQEAVERTPADTITRNRITDRWLLPGRPFGRGAVTVVGDAAHPMTPNLGQGGCTALEDAVVLAQALRDAAGGASIADVPPDAVAGALRQYERQRALRTTKITVRSNLMGQILGSSLPPVCAARDAVIRSGLPIKTFLDHTRYDCGRL